MGIQKALLHFSSDKLCSWKKPRGPSKALNVGLLSEGLPSLGDLGSLLLAFVVLPSPQLYFNNRLNNCPAFPLVFAGEVV